MIFLDLSKVRWFWSSLQFNLESITVAICGLRSLKEVSESNRADYNWLNCIQDHRILIQIAYIKIADFYLRDILALRTYQSLFFECWLIMRSSELTEVRFASLIVIRLVKDLALILIRWSLRAIFILFLYLIEHIEVLLIQFVYLIRSDSF